MVYSIETIKEKSSNILNNAFNDYQIMRNNDKNENAMSLAPGQTMGFANYNGFYSMENRDRCKQVLSNHKAKMNELLNDVTGEIKKKTTEPPTTEQANMLTVLSIGVPTKEELQNALDENKNNYATWSAINRIAAENSLYLDGENPLQELCDLQKSLTSKVNLLDIDGAENHLTPGMMSLIDMGF